MTGPSSASWRADGTISDEPNGAGAAVVVLNEARLLMIGSRDDGSRAAPSVQRAPDAEPDGDRANHAAPKAVRPCPLTSPGLESPVYVYNG